MSKRACLVVALAGVLAVALPARGQEGGDPHLRALFDRITPASQGLTVTIRNAPPSAPLLTVANSSGKRLELIGFDFEPFLRIGPDGVQANTRSRTFYATQDPTGTQSIPRDARAGAVPVWAKISTENEWGWFESRARWTGPIPPAARTATMDFVLGPWSVRGRLGGASIAIEGRIVWHPIRGSVVARLVDAIASPGGFRVAVLQGPVPGLVVTNSSGQHAEIASRDAVPFARVGPNGVDVNLSSATARDNPKFGRGSGWKHIQDSPVLSWLERRAGTDRDEPPEASIGSRTVLTRWSIPATIGTSAQQIRGVTEWIPAARADAPKSASRLGVWIAIAAGAALVGIIAFVVARKRAARE